MRRITRPHAAVLTAVIAVHLALFWLLLGSTAPHTARHTPAAVQRVSLRLMALPMPLVPRAAAPARAAQPDAARTPGPARSLPITAAPAAEPNLPAPISAGPTATLVHAEPAASAPEVSLLDSEATRRAIRASARATSLTAEVARVGGEPVRTTAQERLGNDVKAAGRGDCVKGEYAGAGMGLLSLPFLVAAAARGACAQ